jgi:hypothetical protein
MRKEQSQAPRQLEPRWLRTTGLSLVALFVGVPLLAFIAFFALRLAPIVIAVIAWALLYRLVKREDVAPYTYSRFACGLLVAWALDGLLFRAAVGYLHGSFRHFVPAIIVVSVLVGFFVYRGLPNEPVKREQWFMREKLVAKAKATGLSGNPLVTLGHPFAGFASFLLMLFLMVYVVTPVLTTYLPSYSAFWTNMLSTASDTDDGSPEPP